MNVLVAIHDMMFSSKVTAALGGKKVNWLKRGSNVASEVAATKPDVLLIDLAAPALDSVNAIKAIKEGDSKATTIIGYVDHTRADVMEAARAAGCDQVLSKGEFARRLPEFLQGI
jgi:DNA-binding NarL/FixJ family response regulator